MNQQLEKDLETAMTVIIGVCLSLMFMGATIFGLVTMFRWLF